MSHRARALSFTRRAGVTKVGTFGVEIFFLKVITVVTVEVANRPDGLDHDLKFTRRGFQLIASSSRARV